MAKNGAVPAWFNWIVKFLLRTPLHWIFSDKIMLLTLTGRKSGKTYTIPVSYTQQGDSLVMFTNMVWSKNLGRDTPVTLHLRGRECQAKTVLNTDDSEQIAPTLAEHLRDKPVDARIHKVTYGDDDEPVMEQVIAAAGKVRMVRFELF